MTTADTQGLSEEEAARRFTAEGANEIPSLGRRNTLETFLDILSEQMFALLLGAAAIYLMLGDLSEAIGNDLPAVFSGLADRARPWARAGSVLVTDEQGRLLGIVTGSDAVCRVVAAGKNAETTTIAEVMTRGPETMSPDKTAIEALRLMWNGGFRHIPIVDRGAASWASSP